MSTIEKAMAKLAGKQPEGDDKKLVTEESLEVQAESISQAEAPSETIVAKEANTDAANVKAADAAKTEVKAPADDVPVAQPDAKKLPVADTPLASAEEETDSPETLIVSNQQTKQASPAKEDLSTKYAELDVTYLNRKGYISKQSDNKLVKEQFRAVKRKLLNNAFGALSSTLNNPNLIIVSSCNPHEGKTFSSINLALNIALERDKTVLLVDADVVRPSIVRELGVTVDAGLTEYLSGQVEDVSEIIYNTNIDNFKFIPAGKPHDLSTELLASEKMIALTQELATRYSDRVVIFDAPPLLGVNETHVMANHVGQAVVVVEESKTRLNDIKAAVAQLDENLAIGFLVNKSKRGWRDYYGYGYYRRD